MTLANYFSEFVSQFHFLRPWWLAAIVPLALVLVFSWRKEKSSSDWQALIAPEFLRHLLDTKTKITQSSALWLIAIIWLITTIALAGPSWHKRPTAIEKNQSALVILLDLSPSMLSQDLRPSRLARAKLKITDLMRERTDGLTALAVYAGDAHLVTPLSDDQNTLLNLLPSLDPQIMPVQGSNTEEAVSLAIKLLKNAGAAKGNILLITDGVVADAFASIENQIKSENFSLSILGVGTASATPIATTNGGYLRDAQGGIITTQLNRELLRSLAQQVNGHYYTLATDDSDIQSILNDFNQPTLNSEKEKGNSQQRDFDQWYDEGFWLVFLLLPLILYCFRRGFLSILLIGNLFMLTYSALGSSNAEADTLDSFFKTKNQQAQDAFNQGNPTKAAQEFEHPEWRAAAKYKAGQFEEAAAEYAKIDNAQADYNRGNALAKAQKLEDAITAYDKALKRDPQLSDAKKNRDLVKSMLDQKNQDNQKNNQDQKDKKDQQENQDQKENKDQKDQQKNDQSQDQSKKDSKDEKDSKDQKDSKSGKDSEKDKQQDSRDGKQSSSESKNSDVKNSPQSNQSSSAMDQSAQQNSQSSQSSRAAQPMSQNQASTNADKAKDKKEKPVAADPYEAKMTPEEREAMQQWLRQVPDDPGGLLREKFKWQAIHNREKGSDAGEQNSNNQQRW